MSVKNFKFVSPGVFINEIDNSFIPQSPDAIGPVIIGRARKGKAMEPVKIESFSAFVNAYGDTVAGFGGGDVYRDGNLQSPMYGTYAAKAFLNSNVAPLTYMRLLGQQTSVGEAAGGDAAAGWKTTNTAPAVAAASNGAAYGLFLFTSSSATSGDLGAGELAAVWYLQNGLMQLSGNLWGGPPGGLTPAATSSNAAFICSDANGKFKAIISGSAQGSQTFTFNFNDNSEDFIRNQFNTNPQLKSSNEKTFYPVASQVDYWLGETYEQHVRNNGFQASSSVGIIVSLGSGSAGSTQNWGNMKKQASREAVAGWFIAQDTGIATSYNPANQQKLFRLVGSGHGEWLHKNLKVSIERVRQSNTNTSPFGSFSVVLRNLYDTDSAVEQIERYDNCNLDPTSPDFVARKIGDMYSEWDTTNRRLRYYGEYANKSNFVRVEMNPDVEAGATDPALLPFGYYGPPAPRNVVNVKGSDKQTADVLDRSYIAFSGAYAGGFGVDKDYQLLFGAGGTSQDVTASFSFPTDLLRSSSVDGGLTQPTNAYFGFRTTRTATSNTPDLSVADPHRLLYPGFPDDPTTSAVAAGPGVTPYTYIFSLDNVKKDDTTSVYYYKSGSRNGDVSVTAGGTYKTLLDANYNRFTAPFWGGFDGFDITKPDPLANSLMTSTSTEDNDYVYHTIRRAIETVSDVDLLDFNLLSMPGLTTDALTQYMMEVCQDRADAMALLDLSSVYTPPHEEYLDKNLRANKNVVNTANALKDRRLDSSYGATFYPWVQTRDAGTGQLVWIPPTVAMMGVLGSSESKAAVWFAPAGFNRGGLTEGAAGIPITNVSERLSSRERDTLYDARINPIASFPSNGIVVLGQKTLQERPSALDRINVRRLVIYLKKQISVLSTQILFEQNVQATWDRFKGLIEPFLANVKVQFGITDYRLILDDSTTTPDLIDQNILYAKIMVKPARAIEFIAIDFVIASTGASFDD